ncbi:MAG: T9SS type A sorting domain-containing protein [Candidatus Eisenbacteria bacterium]
MSRFLRFAALVALALLFPIRPAFAAWPHGVAGQPLPSGSTSARSCNDGFGGVVVTYSMYNFGSATYDVYAQRLDADGVAQWGSGVLVCSAAGDQYPEQLVQDGFGGYIAVWSDARTNATTGQDYYAQRISSAGVLAWAANGIPLVTAASLQTGIRVAMYSGYLFCAWADARNYGSTGYDVYAQLVSIFSGTVQWGTNGVAVSSAQGDQLYCDVTADDLGNFFVVWSDSRGASFDVYAQRFPFSSTPSWTANGLLVCNAVGQQMDPRILLMSGRRPLVFWEDLRGADYDIYAQLLDGNSGAANWTANGIAICNAAGHQYTAAIERDATGCAVLAWSDSRRGLSNTQDLYAQRVDANGIAQWASNGVALRVASGNTSFLQLVSDGLGGTYCAWMDTRADGGDVYAQRLNVNGYSMWATNGVPVFALSSMQSNPHLSLSPNGGVFVAGDDYGNNPSYGCRVQYVDEWGYTGANPILASVKDVPNDQGGQVKVSWYGSPLDTDPAYRNITDYVIYRSAPTRLVTQLSRLAPEGEGGAVTLAGKRYVQFPTIAQDYFWEELAHVTPRHLAQYSYLAATEGDSIGGSNPKTAFMVMALANYGGAWWTSKADSGYSVDNLAPAAPAPLTGQYGAGTTALHWQPNAEADLAGYRIYRGSSAGFVPSGVNLVAAVPDTGYADAAAAPYFYKVTAVDTHGNESPVATLMPSGTLAVDGGAARAMFAAPAPNPLRGGAASTLRFALAAGGRAKLVLYDAQGRVARVLVDGALEAGEHAVTLKGDGLAPGLYLARLESPGFAATRRVMIVE